MYQRRECIRHSRECIQHKIMLRVPQCPARQCPVPQYLVPQYHPVPQYLVWPVPLHPFQNVLRA